MLYNFIGRWLQNYYLSLTKKKKNLKDVTIHQSAVDDKTLKYGDEKKFTHPSK